jgi:flagellar M-ring protein FliF
MLDGLSRLPEQLARFWRQLSAAQKLAFASIALIALGAGTLLVRLASEPDYSTLYANLTPEDASSIVDELSTKGVPYKLTQAGTSIQVPLERVYDLRLELASKGMPSSGPVGFEVFDEASLAMTPFQQQVHFRRALEGELERTIGRLQPVKWARVHINLPERSAFQRQKQHPTAAVVLGMAQGQGLSASEAAGITQLLAGAVEGLAAEHVTIVDSKGRLLAQPRGEGDSTLAAGALDVQHQIEADLATRAQTLLDAALGTGKSVVTISAAIERRRFEEQQERVNPNESAVISTQTTEESRTTPAASVGGVPGTPSNLPGGAAAEPPAAQNGSESITRETLNFDVSRSRSTTVVPMGEIQRLSIAVIVDGSYEPAVTPEGEEPPATPLPPVYKPRTNEEIETYTSIVKRAVGFDEKRGDTIEVSNVPFRSPLDGLEGEPPAFWETPLFHTLAPSVLRVALALTGVLLLITMVLRPALRQLSQSAAPAITAQTPAEGGKAALDIPSPDAEIAIPITKDQARHVAEAMRQWLRE